MIIVFFQRKFLSRSWTIAKVGVAAVRPCDAGPGVASYLATADESARIASGKEESLARTGNGELNVAMLDANMDVDICVIMNMALFDLDAGDVGKGVT